MAPQKQPQSVAKARWPGSDRTASGLATFVEKSFWLKPKGIAIWTGGTAAAIALALSLGDDDDDTVGSPSSP